MSQVANMLDRQREYDRTRMAYLTVLDETVDGVQVQYEVRNPLLRRPRITITCRQGTTRQTIREALAESGWDEVVYEQWFNNNGRQMLRRGKLV